MPLVVTKEHHITFHQFTSLSGCPSGYSAYAGSCYKFVLDLVDWYTAKDACIADNGHLVKIEDAAESSFAFSLSG